ncbi:xylulokinase [Zongyangia hominis]|uniref:Xylulose kinase n=1 Tax=Zongyangia hominis TaxID=2763677 RepID=A0A926IAR2_9FIRM|nr:xylulokinase [Zongyangia hominis]MBC8569370.1 xylulokinase [Zongyangia hominis]
MAYLLGIDLGTSSVKALIIDTDGKFISMGQEDYNFIIPQLGYAEIDPRLWWDATVKAIQDALASGKVDAGEVKGIGFSGHMHGLVPVDRNQEVVRNSIIHLDQRCGKQVEQLKEKIGLEKFSQITCNAPAAGFLFPSLLWVKENEPENYAKIDKVMLPKDYIRMRLTGKIATEASDAAGTVAFHTPERRWAWELIDAMGVDRSLFPECHEACDIAGELTKEAAEATGLAAGTPIIYGGSDTTVQSVGNGLIRPGYVISNIGTASQVICCVNHPVYDRKLRTNTFCYPREDLWIVFGASLNGGIAQKWLRDNIFHTGNYRALDEMAETIPAGSEGLLFLPYLCGERLPCLDPQARGMYLGLTVKHTQAHLIRAVMEGMVFALRDGLEIFKELGISADKIIASGGGTKSPLLLQIQADIYGKDIYTTQSKDQASFGAALCAGVGVGLFKSLEEACDNLITLSPVVTHPNPDNVKVYNEMYPLYAELYSRNKELFHRL